jgi:hypothetical protein
MRRAIVVLGTGLAWTLVLTAGPAEEEKTFYVSLKSKANHKLKAVFHPAGQFKENTLASLPTGVQKLGGVKFNIEEGLLQLGSKELPDKPDKIEGITVGRKLTKLYIAHGTGWGSAPKGQHTHVPDDTVIGKYIIHYEDKSTAEIDIAYGRDVRDWWSSEGEQAPDRSKIAWTGENPDVKRAGKKLFLFLTSWENPKPGKKIVTIDYVATQSTETAAAPFCVAMTGETAH